MGYDSVVWIKTHISGKNSCINLNFMNSYTWIYVTKNHFACRTLKYNQLKHLSGCPLPTHSSMKASNALGTREWCCFLCWWHSNCGWGAAQQAPATASCSFYLNLRAHDWRRDPATMRTLHLSIRLALLLDAAEATWTGFVWPSLSFNQFLFV